MHLDLTDRSWVDIVKGFRIPTDEEFDQAWEERPTEYHSIVIQGRSVKLPRLQRAYGRDYAYSGSVMKAVKPTPLIEELMLKVNEHVFPEKETTSPVQFNMCLCNWYLPKHYIGPHRDDTRQLFARSPIASISWGYTRTFVLKPVTGQGKETCIELESGDLVIMGGDCQQEFTHEILKISPLRLNRAGNRINFTFRCFR